MQDSIGFLAPASKEYLTELGCKSLDSFNHTSMIPENPLHRKGSRASGTSGTSLYFKFFHYDLLRKKVPAIITTTKGDFIICSTIRTIELHSLIEHQ